jgi:Fe-S oxidoreductase
MPEISKKPFDKWAKKNLLRINPTAEKVKSEVCLFIDEFTNYNDAGIGIKAVKLLSSLGYRVVLPPLVESGRSYISKGLIRKAKKIAETNVKLFKEIIDSSMPLIGIEPSAILSFRDEYPDLVNPDLKEDSLKLAENVLLIDEFLMERMKSGEITKEKFTDTHKHIRLHGHCQQKAISSTESTRYILGFPENYSVDEIPSGCCGMAGSFGYEKEHYELSMKVGELVLFPEVRKTPEDNIISASGTSCRHQIKDGTGRESLHPVEVLFAALA